MSRNIVIYPNRNLTGSINLVVEDDGSLTFDGDIARINIWKNKTLTAAEVLQNYNTTKWRFR